MSLADWIGKSETRSDVVTAGPVTALSAALDRDDPLPQPGDPLPPLWHWLFFLDRHRASELGPAYEDAWATWSADDDGALWDSTAGDGLH